MRHPVGKGWLRERRGSQKLSEEDGRKGESFEKDLKEEAVEELEGEVSVNRSARGSTTWP